MKTKTCTKCHKRKKIIEFYKNKKSEDGLYFWCKECMNEYSKKRYRKNRKKLLKQQKEYMKKYYQKNKQYYKDYSRKYREKYKWMTHYTHAKQRCNNPKNNKYKYYGGRGIKCLMIPENFEYLWFRDKAYLMEKPSIDRLNNDGNYTLENCRFIELNENIRRKRKNNYEI